MPSMYHYESLYEKVQQNTKNPIHSSVFHDLDDDDDDDIADVRV